MSNDPESAAAAPEPEGFLTTQEVAKLIGVSQRTIQLWSEMGQLDCWKTEGGHRRIPKAAVDKALQERQQQLHPENSGASGRAAAVSPAPVPAPERESMRVLVVENEAGLLRLYRLRLAEWRMKPEVITARNGFEALIALGRMAPHLLITDLKMPEMSGISMLRALREVRSLDSMEIVVVSGMEPDEIEAQGGLPAGTSLLPKPIPFDRLREIGEHVARMQGLLPGGASVGAGSGVSPGD